MSNPQPTMRLPVRLTDPERVQRAQRLAIVSQELDSHDQEVKMYKAAKQRERKPIYAAWQEALAVCRDGIEQRDVPIQHKKDYGRKVIAVIRVDTGEEVDSHPMTENDFQEPLPLNGGGVPLPTHDGSGVAEAKAAEPAEEGWGGAPAAPASPPKNPRKPKGSPKLAAH